MAKEAPASTLTITIRTRFFDDAIQRLVSQQGIEQVVSVAAGLDSRAFRLDLPPSLIWLELDRCELLEHKARLLSALGASPVCKWSPVGTELSGPWVQDALKAGLRRCRTLWVVEGLFCYLDASNVAGLLETIRGQSQPGDWLLTDVVGNSLLQSRESARWLATLASLGMQWRFGSDDPEGLLDAHGWKATAVAYGAPGAHFGRWPWPVVPGHKAPRSYLAVGERRG
jgi:methyltransferase (TIGR00027 family)